MPRRDRSGDFLVLRVEGARETVGAFSGAERKVQNRINRTMRLLDAEAVPVIQSHAPHDTGELGKSIEGTIRFRGDVVQVTFSARAVRDGFNYLPVTRFGHRQAEIRPKRARRLAVHVNGRRQHPIFRRSVRGYAPRQDWAANAAIGVNNLADSAVRELDREIETIIVGRGRGL